MEKLLQPESGLMIWTIVTFMLLLAVLTKSAWKPILDGLHQRESKIRGDLDRAEKAQKDAEALRQQYEGQLAQAQRSIQDMINQAKADAERSRTQIVSSAKEESEKILDKGRKDLILEAERLKSELRQDVAGLSLDIAEKLIHGSVDSKVQEAVFKESLKFASEVKK